MQGASTAACFRFELSFFLQSWGAQDIVVCLLLQMMSNKNTDPKWMTEANRISVLVPPAAAAKTSKDLPVRPQQQQRLLVQASLDSEVLYKLVAV